MLKRILICSIILLLFPYHPSFSIAQEKRLSMSYLYFGSPNSYVAQVDATKGNLQIVAPHFFDIDETGSLQVTWKYRKAFVDSMHERGIKVVPFLSNHWNKAAGTNALLTEEARQTLAENIATKVKELNFDGVNIDIEGILRTEKSYPEFSFRDAFTDLVKRTRELIPPEKEVSVAVAANPNAWKGDWPGFYDYAALAQYTDYIMIMAYDESWENTPNGPGPVASYSFVNRSIQYALNEGVPNEKVVVGLPYYGRMWKTDGPTIDGVSLNGRGISNKYIEELVEKFNGTIFYDEEKHTPRAEFTIPSGDEAFAGSIKLSEGNYIIYFENARSLKQKLWLINLYDLRGAGSWSLIQEAPYTWDFYSLFLNGKLYNDLTINHWAIEDVFTVSDKGWMQGKGGNIFAPEEPLTRAQGAVILARALGLENEKPTEYLFTDVQNHWAKDMIEVAREHNLVNGIGNLKYAPNDPLTREQLATILQNIFQYNIEETDKLPFPDVSPDNWAYNSILAMKQHEIFSGFEDLTFRPKGISTRVQMAALMSRLKESLEQIDL